jgi:hypothetical protein
VPTIKISTVLPFFFLQHQACIVKHMFSQSTLPMTNSRFEKHLIATFDWRTTKAGGVDVPWRTTKAGGVDVPSAPSTAMAVSKGINIILEFVSNTMIMYSNLLIFLLNLYYLSPWNTGYTLTQFACIYIQQLLLRSDKSHEQY